MRINLKIELNLLRTWYVQDFRELNIRQFPHALLAHLLWQQINALNYHFRDLACIHAIQRAVSLNTFSLISDTHTQTPRTQTLMGKKVHFVYLPHIGSKISKFPRNIFSPKHVLHIWRFNGFRFSEHAITRLQDVYLSFSICDDMGSISFILKQIIIT